MKPIQLGPGALDGADSMTDLVISLLLRSDEGILLLRSGLASRTGTDGGRGERVWRNSVAFSSKVVAGVGSEGPRTAGVHLHLRRLLYCRAVKASFLCVLPEKCSSALP